MSTQTAPQPPTTEPDPDRMEEFVGRAVEDIGSALYGAAIWIGDQLGLFEAMAGTGPITAAELAGATNLEERYVREWLDACTVAEYVVRAPETDTYELPVEHAIPLTDPTFPFHVGGFIEFIVPWVSVAPQVVEAFRTGGGVPQSAYMEENWEAIERANAPYQQQGLVPRWIDDTRDVVEKLDDGGHVVDVGCGSGQAAIALAERFPSARVTGYDIHAGSIERARRNAADKRVGERVTFEVRDGIDLPAGTFDVVTTLDVIHDSADPSGMLRAIRNALAPGGTYLAVEMNAADEVNDDVGPVGRMLYSASLLYCMTTSLAQDGAGLGTCMGEAKFRELATDAGFGDIRTIEIDNPFLVLYELHA